MTVKQLKDMLVKFNPPDDMQVTVMAQEDGEKARFVVFQAREDIGKGDGSSPENAKAFYYKADSPIVAYDMPEVVLTIGG